MIRNNRWKVALVVAAALFGFLFTLPNFLSPDVRAKIPGWLPHSTLNLGLDLQGGSRLVYQVDQADLVNTRLKSQVDEVRKALHEAQIGFQPPQVRGASVVVDIIDPSKSDAAFAALNKIRGQIALATGGNTPEFTLDQPAPGALRMTILPQAINAEVYNGVSQAITIIHKRVDALGTKEPAITRAGQDRIVIEAAGEHAEKLQRVIGTTAKLSFQMVDLSVSPADLQANRAPPGSVILPQENGQPIAVFDQALITGDMLTNAQMEFDPQSNQPAVGFRFNGVGTTRFATATSENVGKPFAIVLDNKVISAPRINSAILGGSGIITGNFTAESATELAVQLKSGALPVKLKVLDSSDIGSTLGAESVRNGELSLAVGAAAIFGFIILAYGLFGVFAAIALIVNVLLILAIMSTSQATLTLPGIAGVILTLAVAVDANVLVYERMRDEARAGKKPMEAADTGYRKALISIFDANVTTLIAAAIMFNFGTGAVKGFALTLSEGVLTSVFTAILITQVLIGWWFKAAKPKQLPI